MSARVAGLHRERHFTGSATLREVVVRLSDGLTVPFALAAGLAGAVDSGRLIVVAGLAEIAAGTIAMGLGGYLAARGEADHYATELARERREVRDVSDREEAETVHIFRRYGLTPREAAPVVRALERRPARWVDFMMRYELGLEEPEPGRARRSAIALGGAYAAGGAIPLAPYVALADVPSALVASILVTLVALFAFGALKARFTAASWLRGAVETTSIGAVAAGAAYAIARLVTG